jgi:hypothetical protein
MYGHKVTAPARFSLLPLPYPKRIILWVRVPKVNETKTEGRIEEDKKMKRRREKDEDDKKKRRKENERKNEEER